MTIGGRFTASAAEALTTAAIGALESGRTQLDTDFLLLGLVTAPGAAPVLESHGVTPAAVRRHIDPSSGSRRPQDRHLLATLGIDVDEVMRRLYGPTAVRRDDPARWNLRRSPVRPLRMTIAGPAGVLPLAGRGRKVVEVAAWAAGRGNPASGNHLLWGLLADGSNDSVRILCRLHVDVGALWREIAGGRAAA